MSVSAHALFENELLWSDEFYAWMKAEGFLGEKQ